MQAARNLFKPTALLVIALLVILGLAGYLYIRVSKLSQSPAPSVSPAPVAMATPAGSGLSDVPPDPLTVPFVSAPQPNSEVTSPLTVSGTVPPGWMFEGSLPIQLVDADRKPLAQTAAQETVPGSWQANLPIAFTAKLTFTTTASSGFVILSKDNPSGLAENDASIEIPVRFTR